eukprot:TRINITY_DN106896_c0_g1_i1.p1 TRINITY_DN106896_c0_g1~~TRINITY_DN106896_c0_g1_i1.p1  ORF type:complete len:419 (-),score=84.96 TRINITY_DN106896_c0_g1_i1:79-1335(-)
MAELQEATGCAVRALQDDLCKLFDEGTGDFTIIVKGVQDDGPPQHLTVWQALLSTRSDVFKAMLMHDFTESQDKSMTLEGFSVAEARAFFKFLYNGKTDDLNMQTVVGLAMLADKYQVSSLKRLCAAWTHDNLSIDTVGQIYMSALRHADSADVAETCLQLIDAKAAEALPELHVLPDDVLDAILRREGLCIDDHQMIDAFLKWVETGKKSADVVFQFLQNHTGLGVLTAQQRSALLPRLKKARLEKWCNQASHAPNRACLQSAVFAGLAQEYAAAQLGSKPYLGYWVMLIPSRANLLECEDCYLNLIKGARHHDISMQKGDSLSYLSPHRRVRPQSFSIQMANACDKQKHMTISVSNDGKNWIELMPDTSQCVLREVKGTVLHVSCRCKDDYNWFRLEAQATICFQSFDVAGIALSS